ncbi:MAG TPA: alpha/beta fold hydrolase, partial [Acidimicrobiia bacterium]|nr:alpha/beta fold hydrolase [Acidimicrobiia bacterium]
MASTTRVEFERRDGLRIVGDSWGSDRPPAIIFLHGGGQTRHSWGGAAAAVAASDRHVLTLDARGHGDSDWSENGDYRLVSFADDLRCVIEQLDEPPVIVGASLGGLTTMLLAGELAPG